MTSSTNRIEQLNGGRFISRHRSGVEIYYDSRHKITKVKCEGGVIMELGATRKTHWPINAAHTLLFGVEKLRVKRERRTFSEPSFNVCKIRTCALPRRAESRPFCIFSNDSYCFFQ